MKTSQMISKSTVRIECDVPGGVSVGTGFWFVFQLDNNKNVPLLVTNKHVVRDSTAIRICLNITSNSNKNLKFYDATAKGASDFIHHPDPDIDICALPVAPFLKELELQGIHVDNFFFSDANYLKDGFVTPVEEVFMTGYPNGLWDSVNNRPITRKGITASSPLEDWQGKPEFMIDMACFPGSSGSPVYIMNEGAYAHSDGWAVGDRFIFMGLLHAGPTMNVDGSIKIIDVPTNTSGVVSTKLMMNLGMVIKAEQLNGLKPLLGI